MARRTNTATWHEKYVRWQINVQRDGKRRSFYSSIPGKNGQRECNAKADAWLDDNIEDENSKVETLFAKYVDSLKISTSKSNWIKIDAFGRNWINPEIGKMKISRVNEQHLQDIINKALAEGLAKKTLSNLKATINSFMKYCRKSKATKLLPENLTIPKSAKSGIKRIMQPDSITKLFSVDMTLYRGKQVPDKFINAYRFQVLTGLRPGELLGLMWSDIKGDTIYIQRSINALNEITTGKNDNAVRHFTMTDLAADVLKQQPKISDFIFGETNLSSYSKRWKIYCESNDIEYVSLYEMRHTFVSVAKNLPDGQIKPIIGHTKNMDTFGVYGHEVKGELDNTAKQLNGLFTDIIKAKCVNKCVIIKKKKPRNH